MPEVWEGKIQYGNYIGYKWYGFTSYEDPLVKKCISEITRNSEIFEGYELYVTGGILEGWLTWDLDLILYGPYNPTKIKNALNHIVKIGFKNHIYTDPQYQKSIPWHANNVERDEDRVWHISNKFIKEGNELNLSNYIKVENGLYKHKQQIPYKKQVIKMKEGHEYQHPIKIL